LRKICVAVGLGFTVSFLSIATERCIATIAYVTYEKACSIYFRTFHLAEFPFEFLLFYVGSKILATIIYWVNVIALLIFIGLHSIDRRRKATLAGSHLRVLSTRFQSHENIATTRLITPVMIVVTLLTTSSQ
ncbi:hypothetical protein Angca_001737, partial [Angiostrongylus cantonensis]